MQIKLTYFKPNSGKYCTDAEYLTDKATTYEVHDEVRDFMRTKKLPGLSGAGNYIVHVSGPDIVPVLLFP